MPTITAQQVNQVIALMPQLKTYLFQMETFANDINAVLTNNWTITLPYSADQIVLTTQQQADAVTYYTNLKTQISAVFSQLP